MISLLTLIIALQLVLIIGGVAWFYLWQRPLFIVNIDHIALAIVDDLLRDYRGELHLLSESGTKEYARDKYARFANDVGLPLGAVDRVASLVWGAIKITRGDIEPQGVGEEFSFYE